MRQNSNACPSLKSKLILIVLSCWILPILLIVGVIGGYVSNNINKQQTGAVLSAAENAVRLTNNRLEAAIATSRNASYYNVIEKAYYDYQKTHDRIHLYSEVINFISRQYKYDDKVLAVTLFFYEEPDYLYHIKNSMYNSEGRYSQAHDQIRTIAASLETRIAFCNVGQRLFLVRNLVDGLSFQPFAVIAMELNPDAIFENIAMLPWCEDGEITFGDAVYTLSDTPLPELTTSEIGYGATLQEVQNTYYINGAEKRSDYHFTYTLALESRQFLDEFIRFRNLLIVVMLFAIPLLLLAVRFIYYNITVPIDKLIFAIRHVKGGSLGHQVETTRINREFHYLTESFNGMSNKLKEQFERIYSEELALRDARIMALQSQINPHFLNNTLEIINWEARMENNIKVSKMIESLSTLLDAAMDRHGKPEVRLSEEMIYVDAYLYIIMERLGKRLVVKKELDPDLLDCFVPRLILQPIIENAVEHGSQARQRNIILRAFAQEQCLILEIENDGQISAEEQRHIDLLLSEHYDAHSEKSSNLGIRNVHQRIKILYGADSGLSLRNTQDGHVVARITMALHRVPAKSEEVAMANNI